jgi:hypothetical protein
LDGGGCIASLPSGNRFPPHALLTSTDFLPARPCTLFAQPHPQTAHTTVLLFTYAQAQTQRTMMQQQMTSALYDKMQDSQEGVISVITEVRV